ncbi:uncharacterized protein [Bos indicus]|uniref:Uncharacterized protein isoform X7 n=1 Tax=Bos indicus TaxID=9915 RepID=A0ABM4RNZ9_BOSIN
MQISGAPRLAPHPCPPRPSDAGGGREALWPPARGPAQKRLGPDRAPSSSEPVPLPICDREMPAGLRTRTESASSGGLTAQRWSPLQEAGRSSGDAAGEPWQHLDPGLPQRLLEEKERVLAVLRETVKVLQMKVARLEHPVKLKDQRVRALTRQGDQPQGGGTRGQKGPLPCPPDSDLEPTWKSPRLGVSGCGNALSIRRGATEEDPSQRVHKQKPGPS